MKGKKSIVFVCVHNSARSQMAEAILRSLYGGVYDSFSAGTEPTAVHPLAVEAMGEMGVDISGQKAKHIDQLKGAAFDLAVALCGPRASCPFVPGAKSTVHHEFTDPAASPEIDTFRKVRDELYAWIRDTFRDPDSLQAGGTPPLLLHREE